MTMDVYCAGEQVCPDGPGMTYIYVTTTFGRLRMTADEAEEVGRKLIAAAEYDRQMGDT